MIIYVLTVAIIALAIAILIVAWNVYLDNLSTQRLCDLIVRFGWTNEELKKVNKDSLTDWNKLKESLSEVDMDRWRKDMENITIGGANNG